MSRRSETWNAYESKLAGPLPSLSTSVSVESTAGLDDPAYLVVDPDFPSLREWIRVGTITPGLFENIVRNQEGSVGNIDHQTGAIVRAVFTKQLQDDLFDDIEDTEGAVLSHVNPVQQPDPHSQYLLESQSEDLYVPLAGNPNDPMTGALHLRTSDPTDPEEATKRSYVDASHAVPIADHAAIGNIHHSRYTDAEAIAAVDNGTFLELAGGTMSGDLNMGNNQIQQLGNPNSDDDAVSRGYGDSRWLRLIGGTVSGNLEITGRLNVLNSIELGDLSDDYQSVDLNRNGRVGRIEASGVGFQFFQIGTLGDFPVRINPDQITVATFTKDDVTFTKPVRFDEDITIHSGTNLNTSLRFGSQAANEGMWGDTDEISIGFDGFRMFSVTDGGGVAHVHVRGKSLLPLLIDRDQAGLGITAVMTRYSVLGEPDIDLTYEDIQKIKALP